MNQILEDIYHHPKETKGIIATADKKLIKSRENAQKIDSKRRQAIPTIEKRLIKSEVLRKKLLKTSEEPLKKLP
ncbi:MAG: hypothetical protein O4965_17560 [Trichodesmium sp. St19_bin1]|nr:hypothetical protein [Trichodesmium sp. St19_bin1]